MGDIIIITHSASVARWASTLSPVVGPNGTRLIIEPIVIQLTLAEVEGLLDSGQPELALFAAWAVHDQTGREAQRVVHKAVNVIDAVSDPALHQPLVRAMLSMLSEPLLKFVRETFMNRDLVTISPAAQALFDELEAIGEANALLTVLGAKRFIVDDATRARVMQCTDKETLTRWISRAATAETLEQVFGES